MTDQATAMHAHASLVIILQNTYCMFIMTIHYERLL